MTTLQTVRVFSECPRETDSAGERRLAMLVISIFFGYLIFLLSRPFHSGLYWMDYTQDDFFYYLKVAQNIVDGNGSTFNRIVPTNGYHPLYEFVLILLSLVTRTPRGILLFQATLTFFAAASTYALSTCLLRRTGAKLMLSIALSMWVTLYSLRMFYYGMEVSLAIPLALASILLVLQTDFWQRSFGRAFLLGLLFAATILARLDCVFLILLIVLGVSSAGPVRRTLRASTLLAVALGMTPVALYFLFNHHVFGTWLPISGIAKQLKFNNYPTRNTWDSLYWFLPGYFAVMLPIPIALVIFPAVSKYCSAIERGVFVGCLFFPWVYYFVVCCRSDWPLWAWYMYALRIGVCISFIVFCTMPWLRGFLQTTAVTAVLIATFLGYLFLSSWRVQLPALYDASKDLQQFEASHPGIYAMGDRSGSVGYLIKSPLIQTEGLMMDENFLENIRAQRDLRQVLTDYHVRYYVGTHFDRDGPIGVCFHAEEPAQAGPASPKMRGTFCEKPIYRTSYLLVQTLVFDLQPSVEVH